MKDSKPILDDLKEVLYNAKLMSCKTITFRDIPIENVETVVNDLEFHDAKSPVLDGDGYAPDGTFVWDEWICPHCGSRYEVEYDEHDYCPNCGQKIDWSENSDCTSETE